MKEELTTKPTPKFLPFNRYAHVMYLILVVYLAVKGDYEWAFANLGISLIFDPFDPTVKWELRPLYQKAWLLTIVALMCAGLIYTIFLKN